MTLSLDTIIDALTGALPTEVDGERMMFDMSRVKSFNLNRGGTNIWRRLDRPCRVDSLCLDLEQVDDAPEGKINLAVMALLSDMPSHDLVVGCVP